MLWSYWRPRSWWNCLKLSWPDLHIDQQNKEKLLFLRWLVTLKCPWLPTARDPLAIPVWKMGLLSWWLLVVEWLCEIAWGRTTSTRPAPDRVCTKRGAWWAPLAWVAGTCNSEFVGFQKGKSIVDGFLNWDVAQLHWAPNSETGICVSPVTDPCRHVVDMFEKSCLRYGSMFEIWSHVWDMDPCLSFLEQILEQILGQILEQIRWFSWWSYLLIFGSFLFVF